MKKFLVSLIFVTLLLTGCGSKEENIEIEVPEVVEDKDYVYKFNDYNITLNGYKSNVVDETRKIVIEDDLDYYVYKNLTKEENTEDKLTFKEVNKAINDSHEEMFRLNQEIMKRSPDYYYGSEEYREFDTKGRISESAYRDLAKPSGKHPVTITKDQALEDMEVFEKCLRTYYGCYKWFGRDNFIKANKNLVKWINSLEGDVNVKELGDKMYEEYYFIQDLHFRIAGENRRPYASTELALDGYIFDDYYFLKDDKGYFLKDFSPKTYLTSVNGNTNLDDYVHFSIEPSGELAYAISYKDLEKKVDKTAKIVLGDKEFTVEMRQMDGLGGNWRNNLEGFELVNDYPVLVSRISGPQVGIIPDWGKYASLAHKMQHDLFIHDTRSHGGGSAGIPRRFIEALIDGKQEDHEPWDKFRGDDNHNDFDCKVAYPYNKRFERPELLITLADANNGSCGDEQVELTRNFENSMVIGEPTMCCTIGYGEPIVYLPNSQLFNNIGTHVWLRNGDRELPDGVGYNPDIWVKSIEALDKTTAMLKHYGIESSNRAKQLARDNTYKHIDYRYDLSKLEEIDYSIYEKEYKVKLVIEDVDGKFVFHEKYFDGASLVKDNIIGELEHKRGTFDVGKYNVKVSSFLDECLPIPEPKEVGEVTRVYPVLGNTFKMSGGKDIIFDRLYDISYLEEVKVDGVNNFRIVCDKHGFNCPIIREHECKYGSNYSGYLSYDEEHLGKLKVNEFKFKIVDSVDLDIKEYEPVRKSLDEAYFETDDGYTFLFKRIAYSKLNMSKAILEVTKANDNSPHFRLRLTDDKGNIFYPINSSDNLISNIPNEDYYFVEYGNLPLINHSIREIDIKVESKEHQLKELSRTDCLIGEVSKLDIVLKNDRDNEFKEGNIVKKLGIEETRSYSGGQLVDAFTIVLNSYDNGKLVNKEYLLKEEDVEGLVCSNVFGTYYLIVTNIDRTFNLGEYEIQVGKDIF